MSDHETLLRERAAARVGLVLKDKWKVDSVLGIGGMATVYAATHRNNKRVAIKMLHSEVCIDPDVKARFLREGYVANSVGHAGAVTVDDDDVADDGSPFLVMELLQGETIQARADRKGGTLPIPEVLALADQLLSVLVAAHGNGIVHRDLKPENLFLDRDGQLKVLDFGIARLRETRHRSGTGAGSLLGTPAFMPPEQARGRWEEVDAQSDIWAVGATMFALIVGRPVHEADTLNELLALAITEPARPVSFVSLDVPESVAALIDCALSYAKADRYPSAEAMQVALRDAYEAEFTDEKTVWRAPALSLPEATLAGATEHIPVPEMPSLLKPTTNPTAGTGLARSIASARKPWGSVLLAASAGIAVVVLGAAIVAGLSARPSPEASDVEPTPASPEGVIAATPAAEQAATTASTAGPLTTVVDASPTVADVAASALDGGGPARGTHDPAGKAKKPPTSVAPADPFARRR